MTEEPDEPRLRFHPPETFGEGLDFVFQQIGANGLKVHTESGLAKGRRAVEHYRQKLLELPQTVRVPREKIGEEIREPLGFDATMCAIATALTKNPASVSPRLKDLLRGVPNVFAPCPPSQQRDRTWEVVVAGLISQFCDEWQFEEPDIQAMFGGQRGAIALKLCQSSKSLTAAIKKGLDQCNGQTADFNIVCVNATELLEQDDVLWNVIRRQFSTTDRAHATADEILTDWSMCQQGEIERAVPTRIQNSNRPTTVALFAPLIIRLDDLNPIPMFRFHCWTRTDRTDFEGDDVSFAFLAALQRAGNEVLGFRKPIAS